MKRAALVVLLFVPLFAAACASSSSQTAAMGDQAPVGLIPPELKITQTEGQAFAARHVEGPISVKFAFDVFNPSGEEIKLERLELESLTRGAYSLPRTARPFAVDIPSGKIETVEFWTNAFADDTISGSNGPVTVKVTAYFNSEFGRFRQIYIQQVNAGRPTPTTPR